MGSATDGFSDVLARLKGLDPDRLALMFSAAMLAVFILTMSISMDDEDSIHFARALKEYNIMKLQPHPTGFPVYIFFARFLDVFLSELLALTFLSAALGALCVYLVYLLACESFGRRTALAASVIFALMPLVWLTSIKAMSDMPALSLTVLSMLLLQRHMRTGNAFYIHSGAVMAGIASGIRLHSIFILLPALIYVAFSGKAKPRTCALAAALLIISVLAWLVPMLMVTGVEQYFRAGNVQANYLARTPSLSAINATLTPEYVTARTASFGYHYLLQGLGIDLKAPDASDIALMLLAGALLLLSLGGAWPPRRLMDRRVLFFASCLVIYVPVMYMLLPPFSPRYLIITAVPLAMLIACALSKLPNGKSIRYAALASVVMLLASHSLPLAAELRTAHTPPEQLASFFRDNYSGAYLIPTSSFINLYMAYNNVRFKVVVRKDCESLVKLLEGNATVLSTSTNACPGIRSVRVAAFSRSKMVHEKYPEAELFRFSLLPSAPGLKPNSTAGAGDASMGAP